MIYKYFINIKSFFFFLEYINGNVLLLQHSKFIIKFKISTSMKKLMALLVVAGMTFVACGNKTTEEPEVAEETQVEAEATETEQEPAAEAEAETPAAEEEAPVAE
jgi:hypothetical protein